jgi:hAT family C-terminal dimerisation region
VRELKKKAMHQQDLNDEVLCYLSAQVPETSDPLEFWRKEQHKYPRLVQLIPKYLCCPASSAMSETSFSTMACMIVDKRSRLIPGHVNQLCFIKENYKLIQNELPIQFKFNG